MHESIAKKISIDEFVRALPAGKSQIMEIGEGNFQKEIIADNEFD